MLSEVSIRRAIDHLAAVGDTDLFPPLPELRFFTAQADQIVAIAAGIAPSQYRPVSSVEVLTPKSALGFRIGHQLTATDAVIYCAAVIENGERIEALRQENSGDVAFAYRFDPDGGPRLYESNRSYHDWLGHLAQFGGSDEVFQDTQPVLETDISDFYQRIYFHRIENILGDAGADRDSFDLIRKIVKVTRSKQSFGIPVGSAVSRLLAEGLLCDTDRMLRDMDLVATRYMDDFRIIASARYNTHTILCRLAEHLMVTEGLSLNPSKTRITDTNRLHTQADARLQDVFSSAEMLELRQLMSAAYGEDEILDDDDSLQPDSPFVDGNDLLDRLDELHSKDTADFSSRRAVLKVLRRFPDFDVLRLLKDHKALAYQLPRDFCRAIQAACGQDDVDRDAVATGIWGLLTTAPLSELAYARLWLLNLFAAGCLPVDRRFVQDYPAAPSPLEERQLIFIRARANDRLFFRENRGRLGQASDWLKPALLIGALCLPADEYRNWIDIAVQQMQDPFAKAFGTWLKQRPQLDEILSAK